MCVIGAFGAGKEVSEETLRNCWLANDDGAGFMYAYDGELYMHKGFMTWEDFIKAWKEVPVSVPRVVHFRIATHGGTNEENTHPFLVNYRLGFVHNGIISGVSNSNDKRSDTWHFNEEFLKPMLHTDGKFLEREHNTKLISNYIGGSKLVFLNHKGEMTFINKSKGVQAEEGVWFSNNSYKPKEPAKSTPWAGGWVGQSRGSQPYQPMRSGGGGGVFAEMATIPEWAMEGSYVRIKIDMPQKGLTKGDLVYVDAVINNSLSILTHEFQGNGGGVVEKKYWVNLRDVEDINEYSFCGWGN